MNNEKQLKSFDLNIRYDADKESLVLSDKNASFQEIQFGNICSVADFAAEFLPYISNLYRRQENEKEYCVSLKVFGDGLHNIPITLISKGNDLNWMDLYTNTFDNVFDVVEQHFASYHRCKGYVYVEQLVSCDNKVIEYKEMEYHYDPKNHSLVEIKKEKEKEK